MAPHSDKSGNDALDTSKEFKADVVGLEYGLESHDMTPEEERSLVRKMDLHIFPIVILLYILSFLDRTNIGIWTLSSPDPFASRILRAKFEL